MCWFFMRIKCHSTSLVNGKEFSLFNQQVDTEINCEVSGISTKELVQDIVRSSESGQLGKNSIK